MNPKTTIGLVIALAIALLGVWWAQSESASDTKKPDVGPKPLFDLTAGDLTGFEIKIGDSPTCSFVKKDNKWLMTAPFHGLSQQSFVSADAMKVANLRYVKAYGENDPDRPTEAMTSLSNPLKLVKLTDKAGKTYVLKIGARQQLSAKTYVQKKSDPTIYLVNADLHQDMRRRISEYRSKRIAEYNTSQAVRIEMKGDTHFILVKQDGKWTIESPIKARADAAKITTLLQSISNLTADSFVEDTPASLHPYGLDHPRLTVAVTTEKKTPKAVKGPPTSQPKEPEYDVTHHTLRVSFGGMAEEKVFAKLDDSESKTVFQVAKAALSKIDVSLNELRDKKIAGVRTSLVRKITLTSGSDSVELTKAGTDWKITAGLKGGASDTAEFAAVDDLLKAVGDLKAQGFEQSELPSFGFDSPRAVIKLLVEGQVEPLTLRVGALAPSKTGVYIRNDREGFVAVVPVNQVDALIVKPIAFLSRAILKFDRGQATRLQVASAGITRLVERAGGLWRFTSPVQGGVEVTAINNILGDLSNLRGRRVVARTDQAARYGLDKPTIRATVTIQPPPPAPATTQPAATSQDSSSPPAPPPPVSYTVWVARHKDKVYAMEQGGATICEVDGKVLDDLEAELLDTHIFSLEPSQGRRVEVSGAASFAFNKLGDEWQLVGESTFQVDPSKITTLLQDLRQLKAKRYVRYSKADLGQYGLDKPLITLRVSTDEGEQAALSIASDGPTSGDHYASASTVPDRVFVLKAVDFKKFQKNVTDFQKAQ